MALRNKRTLIWIIAASVAVVVLIASLVAYAAFQSSESEKDPFAQTEQTTKNEPTDEAEAPAEGNDEIPAVSEEPETTIDPETVSTVDVDPLSITVSYVKGIPGFAYAVNRTQSSTEYVDFNSTELVGTKCTNDEGVFATIIKNPDTADTATIAVKKTLDGDVYGLSLPEATCTGDAALFEEYQTSFEDAFGLLRLKSAGADEAN